MDEGFNGGRLSLDASRGEQMKGAHRPKAAPWPLPSEHWGAIIPGDGLGIPSRIRVSTVPNAELHLCGRPSHPSSVYRSG